MPTRGFLVENNLTIASHNKVFVPCLDQVFSDIKFGSDLVYNKNKQIKALILKENQTFLTQFYPSFEESLENGLSNYCYIDIGEGWGGKIQKDGQIFSEGSQMGNKYHLLEPEEGREKF